MALDIGTAIAYLDLDLTAFNTGVETAVSAIDGLVNGLTGQSTNIADFFIDAGKLATNFGNALTQSVTLPLVNFGKSAIDSFIDYESAFTGVMKTLDVGEREGEEITQLYNELSDAIQEMSTRTASSAEEIAGVAEIAGQLGISAEDLIHFTETMIMLGDTTNLSADEAAESLAKLINVTGTSTDDIDKLGSVVVDLGNHFATNESDIVRMATRLASAGAVAGLTEREIMALSTAMSSVGINAEAGGSSMAQTLATIEKIVQGAIGGDEGATAQLEKLAYVSEMSAEQFSTAWQNDPMEALTAFLLGMGNLEEKGESAVLVLDELSMSGIRQSNMLKALGLAGDVLSDAIDTANEAWEENVALTNEAELRYGTTESQLKQLQAEYDILKREIGEMLLPVLQQLVEWARELMEWWRGLSDETKESIVHFAEVAVAVGPVLMVIGKLSTSLGLVFRIFQGLGDAITLVGGYFQGLTGYVAGFDGATKGASGALGVFQKAFSLAWEVVKKAFSMMVSGAEKIITIIGKIGAAFIQHIGPIMKVAGGVTALIGGIVTAVTAFFDMWNNGVTVANELLLALGLTLAAVGAVILGAPAAVAAAVAGIVFALANVVIWVKDHWEEIKQFFKDGVKAIGDFISGLWDTITGFFGDIGDHIAHFFQNMVRSAAEFFDNLFNGSGDFFTNLITALGEFFANTANRVLDFAADILLDIGNFFSNVVRNVSEFFGNIFVNLGNFLKDNFGAVGEFFGNILVSFGEWVKDIGSKLADMIDFISSAVYDFLLGLGEKLYGFFSDGVEAVVTFFSSIFSSVGEWFGKIIDFLGSLGEKLFNIGKSIFQCLWDGIKSIWNSIVEWVQDKFSWLFSLFDKISSFSLGNVFGNLIGGSHANGLDFVPYDGYVAELHKGERVLTEAENKDYGKSNQSSGGDTFNFYNTQPDPYEYARQMKRVKRELALG